jgi:uncharacterized protein YdiU (UPF0061 family)
MSDKPSPSSHAFPNLKFDNSVLASLPLDSEQENFVRRNVRGACFSRVAPTPVENPRVVCSSPEALALLGISEEDVKRREFADAFAGNLVLPGSEPAAHCYCGHQFGNFAGQLGDGRAMYLGEVLNPKGERWELQLKGAGKTPYSRDGDGRAVLRSSIREFLCSEVMHHLGVPTTRAGCVITSDTYVIRDLKYDGHPIKERATIVLRIAPSFLRFGSFQIANAEDETTGRAGPSKGQHEIVKTLTDYTIRIHYPEIWSKFEGTERYRAFFREVVLRTARMVAEWQCVGWAHGVLNTDNMSILGLTIDYGPFGFLDNYDPDFICNASDKSGRYSFANQPKMCHWNLGRLADALSPFLPRPMADAELNAYWPEFSRLYADKMRRKLGLRKSLPADEDLWESLLATMSSTGADFTNVFRSLSSIPIPAAGSSVAELDSESRAALEYVLKQVCSAKTFASLHAPRMHPQQLQMLMMIASQQPEYLEMMDVSPELIKKELEKHETYKKLKSMSEQEKREQDTKKWQEWIRKYRERLLLELESGDDRAQKDAERVRVMKATNPKFILRNWVAQLAIEKAEKGDYSETARIFSVLRRPYSDDHPPELKADELTATPPDWAYELCVT